MRETLPFKQIPKSILVILSDCEETNYVNENIHQLFSFQLRTTEILPFLQRDWKTSWSASFY